MSDDDKQLMLHNPGNVRFSVRRCYGCGRWWAHETFHGGMPECPVCAGRDSAGLRAEIDSLLRSNRALRGKLKGRKP